MAKSGSSSSLSTWSTSSLVMNPALTASSRFCSKFARSRRAPGDLPSQTATCPSMPTLASPCARRRRYKLHEKAWVDVGNQDMTGFAATLCQPCRNRPAASANFSALPARANAGCFQVTDRPRVVEHLQVGETLASLQCSILKDRVAHGSLAVWA
jgi:hypothetical protein